MDTYTEFPEAARTVYFELEKIEGGTKYDVELISLDGLWTAPHSFQIDSEVLRVRLSPGRYQVKTRTYDDEGYYGEWSPYMDFVIRHRLPTEFYPKEGDQVSPIGDAKEILTFEWVVTEGIDFYLFEVYDETGATIESKTISSYFTTSALDVGKKYSWSLTPLAFLEEAKDPNLEKRKIPFEILTPIENLTPVTIELVEQLKAVRYEIELQKKIAENTFSPPTIYDSILPEFKSRLDPGHYEIRVRSIFEDDTKSPWGPPSIFYVPFTSAVATSPRAGFLQSATLTATDPEDHPVEFEWRAVQSAPEYVLSIYNEDGEVIKTIDTTQTKITVPLPPAAEYYYFIQAYSVGEERRAPPNIDSRRPYKFKITEYKFIQLNVSEEPAALYSWVSYQASRVAYESSDFDLNSLTKNNLNAGSFELASGFWHRLSNIGLLATYNLSGITLRDQNYFYTTYGAQIGYRYLIDATSRLRVWAGYAKKDLPQLLASPGSPSLDVKNVSSSGMYYQASYLKDLSARWGLYGLVNFYQGKPSGSETPIGVPITSMRSILVNFSLSTTFKDDYRLRVGYAYKDEIAVYQSVVFPQFENEVKINGHYLMLSFEFGL